MKSLLLLRHAKSSWSDPARPDHDRPLNGRGKRDAPRMGRLLVELDLVPDLVVSSTARRARKTAKGVLGALDREVPLVLTDDLYHASAPAMLACAATAPDDAVRVLLVGHNPGIEELASDLAGAPIWMPTAALARIDLDTDRWAWLDSIDTAQALARGHALWLVKDLPDQTSSDGG